MKLHKVKRMIPLFLLLLCIVAVALCLGACGNKEDEKEVRVFAYGDYMDPQVVKDFEKETGIKVVLDTFDTVEEMYPVIKNRAGVYDVICPSDYMIERMASEDLLLEIDTDQLENYKNIGKRYLELADQSYDPGNKYSVPYQWGTLGIMYNKRELGEDAITSWDDLWNSKYKGKIIMQDSLRDVLGASLKAQGDSLNETSDAKLKQAAEHLVDQKPLVYKYANDSARDLLIGESASLGMVWNGELLYSQELNADLDFAIPEEGTEVFFDCWCIPKNAFHKSNALTFIDYMCRADVAYTNFEYLTYSTPNEAAQAMMPKEIRENPVLFPSDEVLERCETLRDVGYEGDEVFSKYWKYFKSQ